MNTKKHTRSFLFLATCFFSFMVFSSAELKAQSTGDIIGVITEEATGETMPGVNVRIVGTNFGAATDVDGQFVNEISDQVSTLLKLRLLGFRLPN